MAFDLFAAGNDPAGTPATITTARSLPRPRSLWLAHHDTNRQAPDRARGPLQPGSAAA